MAVTPFKSSDAFNMAEFNQMIGEVNTDINGVKGQVSGVDTRLTSAETDIGDNKLAISRLQTSVSGKAPQYQYSTSDIGTGASLATGVLYIVYE